MTKEQRKEYDVKWQLVVGHHGKHKCKIHAKGCTNEAYNGAHHIIPRWITLARFVVCNGITCCPNCHNWAEENPEAFTAWFKAKYPEWSLRVERLKRTTHSPTLEELEMLFGVLDEYIDQHGLSDET